jgi:hypothetical protein
MTRIQTGPDGLVSGGALISVETATVAGDGRAVVLIVYATGPEHAAKIKAGTAAPAFLQLFGLPSTLRSVAALLIRAANAVEAPPSSRH